MKKIVFIAIVTSLLTFKVSAQEWQTSLSKATQLAQEKNKKIILVFQGSDWCAPCIKLDRKIWKSDTFKTYAKDNFVMLKADFPRRKKNKLSKEKTALNEVLAEKYNPQGHFPLIVVLDSKKNVLGTMGYKKMSPQKYIDILSSL